MSVGFLEALENIEYENVSHRGDSEPPVDLKSVVFGQWTLTVRMEVRNKHRVFVSWTAKRVRVQFHRPADFLEDQRAAVTLIRGPAFACVFRG